MPKLVEITDDADTSTKPLSRQASVQSTKSVNSIITTSEVSENQSPTTSLSRAPSSISTTTLTNSGLNRESSIKKDTMVSRSSAGGSGNEQEPLIEYTETTELLSEL